MFTVENTYTKMPMVNPDGSQIPIVFEKRNHAADHAVALRTEYTKAYPDKPPLGFEWRVRKATAKEIAEARKSGNVQTEPYPKIFITGQVEA